MARYQRLICYLVVIPTIAAGGCDVVYVMPNTQPPITTIEMALGYSEDGVVSYKTFYPVFAAMEEIGLTLNIHGEASSNCCDNITVMNAENAFLPTLKELHQNFPKLKIVMEHVTTAEACEWIKSCDANVVGTITAHHLSLVVDDWAGNVFNYCKPVAKLPLDRKALLNAVVHGKGKYFLGTDSARDSKIGTSQASPGVFTQPYACQYVLSALEEAVERGEIDEDLITEDLLRGFLGGWGRQYYGIAPSSRHILLTKGEERVVESFQGPGVEIVPFRKGAPIWSLDWQ
ncbi:MAG: hypothetical protein LQ340_004221 [Diploschistes diacapsis]|nr:MAG: hypothetical protein LQ340_004221 [Diploschistes diacapsis]